MGLLQQTVETTKLNKNGDIEYQEKKNIINTKKEKEKDFLFVFTKSIGYLSNLSKSEIHTLFGLFEYVTMNSKIIVNKGLKTAIATQFNMNYQTVNQSITNLVKKGILGRLERGVYALNPSYFGRGDFHYLKKLRIFQEFDFENMTQKVHIEQEYKTEEERLKRELEDKEKIIKQLEEQQSTKEFNLFNLEGEN